MMTFAAVPAEPGLAQFLTRSIVMTHNVRQFMQACLFAFTDVDSVIRADLNPTLKSVSGAAAPASPYGYGRDM
jgi:hypothetical protein